MANWIWPLVCPQAMCASAVRVPLPARFVVKDSVEENIMELQERKRLLASGALGDGDARGALQRLGLAEMRLLFRK